jgi:hypothetical protein
MIWSYCPVDRQDDKMTGILGFRPQDSKALFGMIRSSSKRQDDRIHGHPGDRSSISCHSVILLTPLARLSPRAPVMVEDGCVPNLTQM